MSKLAIIESITNISSSLLSITGVFTDQISFKSPFSIEMTATSDDQIIVRLRSEYDNAFSGSSITIKPGTNLDLTPPVITPPKPDSPEKIAYFKEVHKLVQYRQALSLTSKIVIDQEAVTESLFKPEYYD